MKLFTPSHSWIWSRFLGIAVAAAGSAAWAEEFNTASEDPAPAVTVETPAVEEPAPVTPVEEGTVISETPLEDTPGWKAVSSDGPHRQKGACPPGRVWATGEVLLWWVNGQDTPPLVTTGPSTQPISQAGVLGAPGTSVLYGGTLNDGLNVGGRFNFGYWFDRCHQIGIQGGFFFLPGGDNSSFTAASDGSTVIARPFFDADPSVNGQNSELVSYPGTIAGAVTVDSSTDIWGADALMRKNLICATGCVCCDQIGSGCFQVKNLNCCRVDMISGFRYFSVDDDISIRENLTVLGNGPVTPGTNFLVDDFFQTENDFYGYDIGAIGSMYKGRWSFDVRGRIALGAMYQQVNINGSTVVSVPGGTTNTAVGGLLTQPTNIGSYDDTKFAVIPEIGFNLGYRVTDCLRIFGGYSFLYISSVARAGDQIDPVVNATQIGGGTLVGPARPSFAFNDTDLWVHGLNFGAEVRF